MTERHDLKTPGRLISGARQAQGLSLAGMSERTKIPPPVLEALEADEYHKVSGALYIKSFLRTCAVELGIDADEVLALYGGMSGEISGGPRGEDMVWEEDEVQISHVGLPWRGIAVAGAALVLLGLGSLTLMRGCGAEEPEQQVADSPVAALDGIPVAAGDEGAAGTDAGPDSAAVAVVRQDTLAAGGPEELPVETKPVAATPDVDRPVTANPAPARSEESAGRGLADVPERDAGPLPVVGSPDLVFAGGVKWRVVARVISTGPVAVSVRRDGERDFTAVAWPAAVTTAPDLPPTGVEAGRVYRVSRGYAIYLGADDNMGLRLGSTDEVEVHVNGRLRDISNLRPGAELLLDATAN